MINIFNDDKIIIFDMETTSFDLDENVLVQFAARKYHGNKLIDKLNILIDNKNIKLTEDFKKRTRLNYRLLKQKGISLLDALKQIRYFINGYTLVSYKGNYFYFQMLWFLFNNQLRNPTVDIVDLAREFNLIADPDKTSLEDLSLSLNLDFNENKWYNASHDIVIMEKIWFKLKSLLKEK